MERKATGERYQRQVILPGFGEAGQQKLRAANVCVIGAGGLGCPVLLYLAAAGIGTIGIIDGDTVSLSNLHRQVLYGVQDLGLSKSERAAAILHLQNPEIHIVSVNQRLDRLNALDLLQPYDIIVDATDNFPSRYLINDACALLGKPLVFGAVSQYEGQVAVFDKGRDEHGVDYRDLFPTPPKEGEVLNCAAAGVLGVLPGIIGSVQAGEVLKLATGIGKPLLGQLQTFNWLRNEWMAWEILPNPDSGKNRPLDKTAFRSWTYEAACTVDTVREIGTDEFHRLVHAQKVTVIDVRERGEEPELHALEHLHLPFSEWKEGPVAIDGDTLITVCQSGKRSRQAALRLAEAYPFKNIYSLQPGILPWVQQYQKETK